MNNWNKFDILHIAASLKTRAIFLYKGIFFMNVSIREDNLSAYLRTMVQEAGGGMCTMLSREILKNSFAQFPCPSCEFVLKNSDKDTVMVPAVVFINAPKKEEKQSLFQFAIAHEIGHVLNGDILPENATTSDTDLGREHERLADAFANELMGSNEAGIELLEIFLDTIKGTQQAVRIDQLVGTAQLVACLIQQRIDWMS